MIDTVVITVTNNHLNLAEVQLFNQGSQISAVSLTFTLSSTYSDSDWYLPASNCDDGDLATFCHSGPNYGPSTLTITSSLPIEVNEIVIWNRKSCCQDRINGATIAAFLNGSEVWSTVVPSTSAMMFSFAIPSQPSAAPSVAPTATPGALAQRLPPTQPI